MGVMAKAVSGWFVLAIIGLLYVECAIFSALISSVALGAVVGWALVFIFMTFIIGFAIIVCGMLICALWCD